MSSIVIDLTDSPSMVVHAPTSNVSSGRMLYKHWSYVIQTSTKDVLGKLFPKCLPTATEAIDALHSENTMR